MEVIEVNVGAGACRCLQLMMGAQHEGSFRTLLQHDAVLHALPFA